MLRKASLVLIAILSGCTQPAQTISGIPTEVYLRIVEAEDTRRWDPTLESLLKDPDPAIRKRAALAAGRIGDEKSVPSLSQLLKDDTSEDVRATAAFALGETEAPSAAASLLAAPSSPETIEALGKITAALPESNATRRQEIGKTILAALKTPQQGSALTSAGLTAVLRAKPDGGPAIVAMFLTSSDPRIRADALNTLARLRAKESLDLIAGLLTSDPDPLVRANAARVLGGAGAAAALDALAMRMSSDSDLRVRIACIRALASIGDRRAGVALMERGKTSSKNELLEIATALGRVYSSGGHNDAVQFLVGLRGTTGREPEIETALARIAPAMYLDDERLTAIPESWREASSVAAALTEIATVRDTKLKSRAQSILRTWIESPQTPDKAMPDVLRAFQAFKPPDLAQVARGRLKAEDVIVRSAAADILAELPSTSDTSQALSEALPGAMRDAQNDAALSIVSALSKAQDTVATEALLQAAKAPDHLIRRRAIDALKGRPGVTAPPVGPVSTRNTRAGYLRAIGRIGRTTQAVLSTEKGDITIELLAEDAPLTVDSFVTLAESHYFDGLTFHRVVPNFVIQGGDPRGDGNGGPGYTIRCEINSVPYDTGTVGMALAGKDTGGSQFFITHSPQPHLDGGYTVFGRVVAGQDVVDRIERGDRIRSVKLEGRTP